MIIATDTNEFEYGHSNEDFLLRLLDTSTFGLNVRHVLKNDIKECSCREDYDALLFKLFSNQLDRITSGLPYSQTDILKHLKKLR